MRTFIRDDHTIRLGLLGVILTLIYVTILTPLGFLEGLRSESGDRFFAFRNTLQKPLSEAEQLLLVTIDDESQRHLNQKWPWDRTVFAEFLRKVAPCAPKSVLFDFAFLGQSSSASDAALAQAIREGPRVLLAAYLDPEGELMLPNPQFTQAGGIPGLINKPLDRDLVIRRLWAKVQLPGRSEPLYGIEPKTLAITQGMSLQKIPVGRLGELPINYLASLQNLKTISFWKILHGEFAQTQLQGKLIIVGGAREITHDVHSTPLGRMPGMAIEANGILTLLTGRFIKTIPPWCALLLGSLLTVGILQIGFRCEIFSGIVSSLGITALALLALFLLSLSDFSVDAFGVFFLAAGAWVMALLYKYVHLLTSTLHLYRQVTIDPVTGSSTGRFFQLQLDEELRHIHILHRCVGLILVQVSPMFQLLQRQSWEETRHRFRALAKALQGDLPFASLVGRLQEDRLGILLHRTTLPSAKEIALRIQKELGPREEIEAFGVAVTDGKQPAGSAEDLIRCAEAALHRAREKGRGSLEVYDPALDRVHFGQKNSQAPGELEVVASEIEEKERSLEKAFLGLRQAHQDMESSFLEVTKSLVLALETKDTYTAGHLERVCRYATGLAQELQLPKEEIEAIREAALLHDIGKIGLPDEVLHKVGSLTEEERDIIKQHLSIGAKILEPMKFFRPITTLIYHHHERYDGKGYPHSLSGEFIPSGAQVIAIADSFDAMTTHRGYNKPKTVQEALEELRRGAGTQFNPLYVEKFIQLMNREGPQLAGHAAA